DRALLRKAAVCVSLVAATGDAAYRVLSAVEELRDDPAERRRVRRTLTTCLSPAPEEGLAVRPDPVGDHLLLRELDRDPTFLARTLDTAGEQALRQVVSTLTRAGQNNDPAATRHVELLLRADPGRWPTVLDVAATQGGPALAALEELVTAPATPLPLDQISATSRTVGRSEEHTSELQSLTNLV